MQMVTVGVRTDNGFIFVAQQPPRKLYACFVGLFRCDLARCVGVYDMITENPTMLIPAPFGFLHLQKRLIQRTVDRCLQSRLVGIADIIYCIGQICLFFILNVIQTTIQPGMNGDDFIISHLY